MEKKLHAIDDKLNDVETVKQSFEKYDNQQKKMDTSSNPNLATPMANKIFFNKINELTAEKKILSKYIKVFRLGIFSI